MFRQQSILDYCPIGGKISEDDKIETCRENVEKDIQKLRLGVLN